MSTHHEMATDYPDGQSREEWLATIRRNRNPDYLKPESPHQALWRYMDFAKFVALLESREIFFSAASLLGDDFEGSITAATLSAESRLAVKVQRSFNEYKLSIGREPDTVLRPMRFWPELELDRQWTFVSCWHANESESAAMWKLYAASAQAVAISTTYQLLDEELDQHRVPPMGEPLLAGVRYIDFECDPIPGSPHLAPFLYKRLSFAHEREVRAIVQDLPSPPAVGSRYAKEVVPPVGRAFKIDLTRLITGVRVAPGAPPWLRELTARMCLRYGLTQEVGASVLDARPIW